jgi:hypothetical protein
MAATTRATTLMGGDLVMAQFWRKDEGESNEEGK